MGASGDDRQPMPGNPCRSPVANGWLFHIQADPNVQHRRGYLLADLIRDGRPLTSQLVTSPGDALDLVHSIRREHPQRVTNRAVVRLPDHALNGANNANGLWAIFPYDAPCASMTEAVAIQLVTFARADLGHNVSFWFRSARGSPRLPEFGIISSDSVLRTCLKVRAHQITGLYPNKSLPLAGLNHSAGPDDVRKQQEATNRRPACSTATM